MASINDRGELPAVTYGFIGLGSMGYPMAKNLRSKIPATSVLIICDVVESVLEKFISETPGRITIANTPNEVSQQSEMIITMLPSGSHVTQVFTSPTTGLLSTPPNPPHPKLFIDCSTIPVSTSLSVSAAVTASTLGSFADIPVSGGPTGAAARTLTFMAGGPAALVEKIKPIALTMGTTFFHCGALGAGLATKQINNYVSGVCMLGTAEGMNLGIRAGLDAKVLAGVINSSTGRSYNSEKENPVKGISAGSAAERDFGRGFSIELCKGVLHMAVELGERVGARLPLSRGLMEAFETASGDERCRGKDCRSVYRYVADN